MSLAQALGGMRDIAQFFIWRLEWDAEEGKYLKTPCAPDGSVYRIDASKREHWMSYDDAMATIERLRDHTRAAGIEYTLGFWMTAGCGYWFLDMDKCATEGVLSSFASQMVDAFPGALTEWSSSGRGVHIIGRTRSPVPPHRSKPEREIAAALRPVELEFYTEGRGIAFGLDGVANGDADTFHDAPVLQLCADYFPPRAAIDDDYTGLRRPDWRGPEDDDELIRRALQAKKSAEVAFGRKASFESLWRGEVERDSSADMALASHLAFWTGCDEERMERLMLRSGLVRDKWSSHRTYLRELTIRNACTNCESVYQEPVRDVAVQREMYAPAPLPPSGPSLVTTTHVQGNFITAETAARVDELMTMVAECGTVLDMHNIILPAIRATAVPDVFTDQLVTAVNRRLDVMGAKLPVGKLRALVRPPVAANPLDNIPDWVTRHCYVKDGDYFYDMGNGAKLTYQSFVAEYARCMPLKQSGARENPAEWSLNHWHMTTVHHVGYRPDQGPYFKWDNFDYANSYNEASVPVAATQYTDAGVRGIEAFQQHLFDMCGRRVDVFNQLLWWCAHNVQKPGVKIRWSPIIKGCPGDGKSLLTTVLRAAMGFRNVGVTGNSTLNASGGFTDWAVGYAVNVIEEIWLTGKLRYMIYNATKEFITNDVVDINPKGRVKYNTFNTTNHLALSNHNDAIPLEPKDRRWMVVFTPWESLDALCEYCGLDEAGWLARTSAVDRACKYNADELRLWLLSVEIGDEFNKDYSAPVTPEKRLMLATSRDDAESVAQQIIMEGCSGVSINVISSACLSNQLKIRALAEGFELPKGPAMNHMMTRLGYSKVDKMVKWRNSAHTIWIRNGINDDSEAIRSYLDASATQKGQSSP